MDHVILADKSETMEIQMKTMDWAGKLTDLFRRANTTIKQSDHGTEDKIQ
jgi:hypothetical protein